MPEDIPAAKSQRDPERREISRVVLHAGGLQPRRRTALSSPSLIVQDDLATRGKRREGGPQELVVKDHPAVHANERRNAVDRRRGKDCEVESARLHAMTREMWRARERSAEGDEAIARGKGRGHDATKYGIGVQLVEQGTANRRGRAPKAMLFFADSYHTPPIHMSFADVALYAALAAAAAGLGPVLAKERAPDDRLVGLASAIAAGMMLGLAYPMMRDGLDGGAVVATASAAAAVVMLFLIHLWFGLDGGEAVSPVRAVLGAAVHAAPEGLALGVALAVDQRFGLIVAFTLALHNVGEGVALSSHLVRHEKRARAAAAAALSNVPQVAMAMGGFVLASAYPPLRPALLGASAGSLVYLSLADLLPDGYRATGRTAISVVVIVATSIVAFAEATG